MEKVPLEMLLHKETEIPAFTSEAFHFYLPAFLSAVLRYSKADIMLEAVVSSLIPSPTSDMKFIVERSIDLFNNAEKALILEFLERHSELFPQSNYVILENDRLELQRAIQFWQMSR